MLGDYIEPDSIGKLAYVIPLSRQHESNDNPGLIRELMEHLQILFKDQNNTRRYNSFMQELRTLWDESDSVVNTDGEVNSPKKFDMCIINVL